MTLLPQNIKIVNSFASKIIPDEFHQRWGLRDPKPKFTPSQKIKDEHLVKEIVDPHLKKNESQVKRVNDEHITEVKMKDSERVFTDEHLDLTQTHHHVSVKRRDIFENNLKEASRKKNQSLGLPVNENHQDPLLPLELPSYPTRDFLMDMIIKIYIRDMFLKTNHSLQSMAITIEKELNDYNINYQSITIQDNNVVQILCNYQDEREHIKHLMLDHQYALCLEMEGSYFFSRFVKEDEKKYFFAAQEYYHKQRLQHKQDQLEIHKSIVKEIQESQMKEDL